MCTSGRSGRTNGRSSRGGSRRRCCCPRRHKPQRGLPAAPEPPRLRQFFPETLFWLPEQETDANGHLTIDVPIADSITTWRVSVIASDKNGNLGSAQAPLKVFQDFFVEPDFPRFLTVGDEISVPVSSTTIWQKSRLSSSKSKKPIGLSLSRIAN